MSGTGAVLCRLKVQLRRTSSDIENNSIVIHAPPGSHGAAALHGSANFPRWHRSCAQAASDFSLSQATVPFLTASKDLQARRRHYLSGVQSFQCTTIFLVTSFMTSK